MKSKGPPKPIPQEGVYTVGIGGSAIGNAFGAGSSVTFGDRSINIQGDVINSQVGQTLTDCINMAKEAPPNQKAFLETLTREVKALIEQLPEDKQEEAPRIAKKLETLVTEARSKKPDREWYSLSAKGLLEAATWVKDFSAKIAGTIKNLGQSLWPDFSLPEVK